MALDYSKLSDEELEAIANDDYSKLSDKTLNAIANDPDAKAAPEAKKEPMVNPLAPAIMGYGMQPTGMAQLGEDVFAVTKPLAQSLAQGVGNVASVYRAHPIAAPLADVIGMSTVGIPPVATSQSALGAYDKWKAIEAGKNVASQVLSQGAPATTPVTGAATTATKGPYAQMYGAATPEVAQQIKGAYGAQTGGGGNNAVRAFLNSAEGKAAMAANPEFASKAAAYLEAVPTYGQQAMRVAGPILRGAARVAGPVGMAANIYEAAPYLAEAGPELSSGRARNRIAEAQRMVLNAPTPAPLTPEEASNLLASGDTRTINIYGGPAKLQEIVNNAVRQKAAKKVLAPIAPGQQ